MVPVNIARGLSTDRVCEVGAMTMGNISLKIEKQLLLYLLDGFVNQREIRLFRFSKGMNKEELMIKSNITLRLQWHDVFLQ